VWEGKKETKSPWKKKLDGPLGSGSLPRGVAVGWGLAKEGHNINTRSCEEMDESDLEKGEGCDQITECLLSQE